MPSAGKAPRLGSGGKLKAWYAPRIQQRTYYLDEDTFALASYDAWIRNGELYRSMMMGGVQF